MSQLAATGRPTDPGASLIQLLHGHPIEGFERSFKMAGGRLLADRFLLGIHKANISPPALFSACARMGMPAAHLAALKANAEGANVFHFGFEGGESDAIYKVYLEFAQALAPGPWTAGERAAPMLLHLAFKWSVANPTRCTIARYECFPGLRTPVMRQRLARLYAGRDDHGAVDFTGEVIALAERRISAPPMYIEVTEEGNPRASFDVNLHDAQIALREIESWLTRMRERFAIPPALFDPVLARAGGAMLGHLSGGIGREGGDFLTVYYAAEAP